MAKRKLSRVDPPPDPDYGGFVAGLAELLEQSRRRAARAVNSVLTATYWEVGRRIVEFEQGGEARAQYGEGLLKRLAADLTAKFGRGFGKSNLFPTRDPRLSSARAAVHARSSTASRSVARRRFA